jgi:SAM-dependent methyltransferase
MKDLDSYKKHNSEYETDTGGIEHNENIYKKYDQENQFKNLGFEDAIMRTENLPLTHIDIGSGVGWLLRKTSPYFKDVIGIEPSTQAIKTAEALNKNENVSFLNEDMVDGLQSINPTEPVFITTSVVLSHIKDFYVADFLKLVNALPAGSVLFFDERYDKNIQWNLWYIRSKDWWAKNLPEWNLNFMELENSDYKSGIYGIKTGENNTATKFKMNVAQKILWTIQGIYYKAKRIVIDVIKKTRK